MKSAHRTRNGRSQSLARLALAVVVSAGLAGESGAQGIRITGVTSMQLVELRPLALDSVLATTLAGTDEWRTMPDGTPARCGTGLWCTFYRSAAMISAAPLLQDLSLSSWGLAEGLSFHADLRARTQLASQSLVYPRADDHLDVLDAWAELQRPWGRARLGRQWLSGGLGTYDFDGASALVRRDRWSAEGWAGRALVAGLNDSHASGALAAVENIPPTDDGWIFGARARFRSGVGTGGALMYQRIVVADQSGVYAERAAADFVTRVRGATLDGAFAYDFATGAWNEARLRVAAQAGRGLGISTELRHSVPFFELWTIWGAFSPVGFNEARAAIDWRPSQGPFGASLRGAYRKYEESNAEFGLRTNGWRAGVDVSWAGAGAFTALATYDVDIGNGASRNDARGSVRWNGNDETSLGLDLTALQTIYEFRVGTGRVFGLAIDGSRRIRSDLRVSGDIGVYRHQQSLGAAGPDWTQKRAALRLEWSLGRDPGAGSGKR